MRRILGVCIVALAVALLGVFALPAWASSFDGNGPYVVAHAWGLFYAKSVPHEREGDKGVTRVMRVGMEADELLVTYPWYAERGLVLGWSPQERKVGVMRIHQQIGKPVEEQIELSFYLGEKFLKSYTTADLLKMGARAKHSQGEAGRENASAGQRGAYTAGGCRQVWNTDGYYFVIKLNDDMKVTGDGEKELENDDDKELKFDILTGRPCRVENDSQKQRGRMVFLD